MKEEKKKLEYKLFDLLKDGVANKYKLPSNTHSGKTSYY
jgi:hypothetical protein